MKTILITGGAAFIGPHACITLAQAGHQLGIFPGVGLTQHLRSNY